MLPGTLNVNDVVQLDPTYHLEPHDGFFGACFMIVTEVKKWGAQGVILVPQSRGKPPGHAYYRAKWEEMEYVGRAHWAVGEKDEPQT